MEPFWAWFWSLVWIPITIIIVISFHIFGRRRQKQLRESLIAKTDQVVYEGASADLLQLIHDLSDIGIQTKAPVVSNHIRVLYSCFLIPTN